MDGLVRSEIIETPEGLYTGLVLLSNTPKGFAGPHLMIPTPRSRG
jgi:hypothetical protein